MRVNAERSEVDFGSHHTEAVKVESFAVGLSGDDDAHQRVVVMVGGAPLGHALGDAVIRLSPDTALRLGQALVAEAHAASQPPPRE